MLGRLTTPLFRLGVDSFPSLPEYQVDLHINQQGYDEGDIEGHNGRVNHKGWIGDHTLRGVACSCGEMQIIESGGFFFTRQVNYFCCIRNKERKK